MKRIYSSLLIVLGLLIGSTITFGQQTTTTGFDQLKGDGIKVYSFGKKIHVKADVDGTIQVYNLGGKLVVSKELEGSESGLEDVAPVGVYIVKVGNKVCKVIIK